MGIFLSPKTHHLSIKFCIYVYVPQENKIILNKHLNIIYLYLAHIKEGARVRSKC